nr:hypothetical protein [Lachnospiraceae bacterium]
IARKEEEKRLAEEEKAKKEAEALAEKEAKEAEKQAKKEAKEAEKQAKKEAEKQAAAEKEAEKQAEKQAKIDAANNAAAEKEAKEKEAKEQAEKAEKEKIDNAKLLGTDLFMSSHKDEYIDKYFKVEGTVEKIEENYFLVRYLSVVANHKQVCWVWIESDDISKVHIGDNVVVTAQYKEKSFPSTGNTPTLLEKKVEQSSTTFFSILSSKAKVVNSDIDFDTLLRYGEYQEFVYVEGTVTNVFENCLNIRDSEGNYYLIVDDRIDTSVVLQGDYLFIYGQFEGVQKDGYVWPVIRWLVDGKDMWIGGIEE